MQRREFRQWVARAVELTGTQRRQVLAALQESSRANEFSVAVEQVIGENRTCPHCGAADAWRYGSKHGKQIYRCRDCRRTFDAMSQSPLSRLTKPDRWHRFSEALAAGESLSAAARCCGISRSTAYLWRDRFRQAAEQEPDKLQAFMDVGKTFTRGSRGRTEKSKRSRRPHDDTAGRKS